jgi:hypothetical protein
MRCILVEQARRRHRQKRGGAGRVDLVEDQWIEAKLRLSTNARSFVRPGQKPVPRGAAARLK